MVQDTSFSSRVLDIVVHVILLIVFVVTLYPILNVISISLSANEAVARNEVSFFPQGFDVGLYVKIITEPTIPNAMKNSIIYTTLGTAINLVLTSAMAFALSKKWLLFRGFWMIVVMVTMYFSGGLIPTFIVVKKLGMYDTIWALVLPGAISVWFMIIMRTFFQAVPAEMEDAARVDGANDIYILLRVVLPLSKAAIATIGLFYAVGHWNSFFGPYIYLKSAYKFPLQVILHQIVILAELPASFANWEDISTITDAVANYTLVEKLKYAVLFVSIIPMLILYPFVQRYFVRGVMIGSLKG